jgi:hypothetical protein
MKKTLVVLVAIAAAALAADGLRKQPYHPLTISGTSVPNTPHIWPIPACPPDCSVGEPGNPNPTN